MRYAVPLGLLLSTLPAVSMAQGQVTLESNLESSASVRTPAIGPGGTDSNIYYLSARTGRGANVIPGSGARHISFPVSAINLNSGSFEVWYRPNNNPAADLTTRTVFAVATAGQAPVMVLEEGDRLRFRVVTNLGVREAVGSLNAAVWPRWSWSLVRAEWSSSAADSLRVYVNGVRISMTTVPGGWTATAPSTARLYLGGRDTSNTALADGILDEVRVRSTSGQTTTDAGTNNPDARADAGSTAPDAAPRDSGTTTQPDAGTIDGGVTNPGGGTPSAGCGPTNGARGVMSGEVVVNGQLRSYILSVPASYDSRVPLALAFGWHGTNWNGANFRTSSDIEAQSGGQAIFVYPNGAPNWNTSASSSDIAFFDALYQDVTRRYCVDTSRVFTWGRSLGAGFSHTLACQRGSRFAGNGALMGFGPNGTCTTPRPSAWVYHNMDDPTVSYSSGVQSREFWRQANGCTTATTPSTPATCVRYTQCANGRMVEWCSQPTGGHVPHSWTGAALWRFFSANF